MPNVKLVGFKEFKKAIRRNPTVMKKEANEFFVRSRRAILTRTQRNPWSVNSSEGGVPVATGNMRRKWETTTFKPFSMTMMVDTAKVPYAEYVHKGTKNMKERPWLYWAFNRAERDIDKLAEEMTERIVNNLAK